MTIPRSLRRVTAFRPRIELPKVDVAPYVAALRRLWETAPPPPDRVVEAAKDLDVWFKRMGTRGATLKLPFGTLTWAAHPSELGKKRAETKIHGVTA